MNLHHLIRFTLVLGLSTVALVSIAQDANILTKVRDPVPKGWLVIRSGAANTNANYDKEDRNINGQLIDVSALCAASSNNAAAIVATDHTRTWGNYMTSNSTTIINLGGKVVKDPLTNNPHHCLIGELTVPQIKGIWH